MINMHHTAIRLHREVDNSFTIPLLDDEFDPDREEMLNNKVFHSYGMEHHNKKELPL